MCIAAGVKTGSNWIKPDHHAYKPVQSGSIQFVDLFSGRTHQKALARCIPCHFTMAQRQVTRGLGSALISYRNETLRILHSGAPVDLHDLAESMHSILHILHRVLERDLPHLSHHDTTCMCKQDIAICFNWVLQLETLVAKRMKQEGHDVSLPRRVNMCWLFHSLVKYSAAAFLTERI